MRKRKKKQIHEFDQSLQESIRVKNVYILQNKKYKLVLNHEYFEVLIVKLDYKNFLYIIKKTCI